MVLAATPNEESSGQRRGCITFTIEKHSIALMQCAFVLSAPTLMCDYGYIVVATYGENRSCDS